MVFDDLFLLNACVQIHGFVCKTHLIISIASFQLQYLKILQHSTFTGILK